MNITNELKAKVFAQYLGVKPHDPFQPSVNWTSIDGEFIQSIETGFEKILRFKLILKPLSAITDEDGNKIMEFSGCETVKDIINCLQGNLATNNVSGGNWLQIIQYLQSKGYDLPHYLLAGKTLHEAGLAIYE